jgi:hypothetical protein
MLLEEVGPEEIAGVVSTWTGGFVQQNRRQVGGICKIISADGGSFLRCGRLPALPAFCMC